MGNKLRNTGFGFILHYQKKYVTFGAFFFNNQGRAKSWFFYKGSSRPCPTYKITYMKGTEVGRFCWNASLLGSSVSRPHARPCPEPPGPRGTGSAPAPPSLLPPPPASPDLGQGWAAAGAIAVQWFPALRLHPPGILPGKCCLAALKGRAGTAGAVTRRGCYLCHFPPVCPCPGRWMEFQPRVALLRTAAAAPCPPALHSRRAPALRSARPRPAGSPRVRLRGAPR